MRTGQLAEVNELLLPLTGFRMMPVAGLVTPGTFLREGPPRPTPVSSHVTVWGLFDQPAVRPAARMDGCGAA